MLRVIASAVVSAAVLLSGCASVKPQQPVEMNSNVLRADGSRVGVIMSPMPQVDTQFPGAGCLLCIATASAMNSKLTAQAKTLGSEDLARLRQEAAAAIVKRGGRAVALTGDLTASKLPKMEGEAPNLALRDHRALAASHQVDRLLVVDIKELGFTRPYSAYVPTDVPRAVVRGVAYMVNLRTNEYDWYQPIDISKGAANWDQPPNYAELTNAYYQAVELARDVVMKPLR